MKCIGFGDGDDAGGIAIEAVDDAGSGWAADGAEVLEVVGEGTGECTAPMSFGGMDDHPRGFVDDHEVFIFEEDIEIDFLGFGPIVGRRRKVDLDRLAGLHFEAWFDIASIESDVTIVEDFTKKDSTISIAMEREKEIDSLSGFFFFDLEDEVSEGLGLVRGFHVAISRPCRIRRALSRR